MHHKRQQSVSIVSAVLTIMHSWDCILAIKITHGVCGTSHRIDIGKTSIVTRKKSTAYAA